MAIHPALEAQIQRSYAALSAAEKKLADVLLTQQKALMSYSATELAELAGVSKASAARFFRRLGYVDFNAFRQALREQVSEQSPLYLMEHASLPGAADGAQKRKSAAGKRTVARPEPAMFAALQAHVQRDSQRLAALCDQLGEHTLETTLDKLVNARRVWVVGYRNSYMLAFYASALLSQSRPEVYLLSEHAGKDAELIAEIEAKDVLLAMDFRRRARRLAGVVTLAREAGAGLVLLSDAPMSTLAASADAVLRCSQHSGQPGGQVFDSYVAAVSLINFLATAMVGRTRKRARVRMARVERAHDVLGDLES